jgi:AraC-like DNA-binding protein
MPTKIENIRAKNLYLEAKEEEHRKEEEDAKALELQEKIGTRVDTWVVEKKYCRPELTIKDVALEMGTNHNYLSAYLNKSLNVNFQTWLNTLRIEESKTYLTSGEKMSIEEIGIRVGIPQSYNFSRWFRIVVGKTPLQYKKEHTK